jgi:DNA-binding IclR family transcriptional regulator
MGNPVSHRETTRVKAVERALDLLLVFAEDAPEMGVTELSRRLRLPKGTVHRLLGGLVSRGLVTRDPDGRRYRLGPTAFRLGSAFLRSLDVRQAALPVMQELARKTGETVNLNVVQGIHRVCIEKVDSVQDVRHFVELGRPLPMFAGASGKVLLAHLNREAAEAVLKSVRALTPYTVTDVRRLRAELERIRRQGFAVSHNERVDGASAVSAPVRDAQGGVVAGLTVSGPSYRLTPARVRELIPQVVEAAAEISARLGYPAAWSIRSPASEASAGGLPGKRPARPRKRALGT